MVEARLRRPRERAAFGDGGSDATVRRIGVQDLTATVLTRKLTGLAADRARRGIRERLHPQGRREQKGQEMTSVRTDQPTHRSQAPGPIGLRRVVHLLQTSVVNPLIRLAFRIGIPDPGDAVLATTGRRSGKPRLTPVCDGLEGDTFWLLSQRGRDADWVRDIESDPRVRVNLRSRRPTKWRSGTAHIVDDDDPHERQRILSRGKPWRRLCLSTSGALATDLLTVRVDLDPEVSSR